MGERTYTHAPPDGLISACVALTVKAEGRHPAVVVVVLPRPATKKVGGRAAPGSSHRPGRDRSWQFPRRATYELRVGLPEYSEQGIQGDGRTSSCVRPRIYDEIKEEFISLCVAIGKSTMREKLWRSFGRRIQPASRGSDDDDVVFREREACDSESHTTTPSIGFIFLSLFLAAVSACSNKLITTTSIRQI